MIIYGTRGVKSTIKSGDFMCPQCNTKRPYRHRSVRRFFTLYFIPIIPLDKRGEYVECGTCKGTFVTRVLDIQENNPAQTEALYETTIKHSMVMMMLADGVIDESEKKQVLNIINRFSKIKMTTAELNDYINKVQQERIDVTTYLSKVNNLLNEHGKELLIKCALSVAAADGNIDESEIALINNMAKALDMSPAHLKGILSGLDEIVEKQRLELEAAKNQAEDHSRFMPR